MGATQLKKYLSYLRKSARSRCWSLGWSRRLGQRRDTLTRPAGLYLGVSECGSGVEPCQGGSQRYSLPSIVIKSYVLICQVSPASICHERGEQRGLCDLIIISTLAPGQSIRNLSENPPETGNTYQRCIIHA